MNLLFARRVREASKAVEVWSAVSRDGGHVTPAMIHNLGSKVLWDGPQYLNLWSGRSDRRQALIEIWMCELPREPHKKGPTDTTEERERTRVVLPLAVRRGKAVFPYSSELRVKRGDELHVLVRRDRREIGETWLLQQGWKRAPDEPDAVADAAPQR